MFTLSGIGHRGAALHRLSESIGMNKVSVEGEGRESEKEKKGEKRRGGQGREEREGEERGGEGK